MAFLQIISELNQGATLTLGAKSVILGREPNCDFQLHDAAASRRHAAVAPKGDGWEVQDLGSRNQTYLNGLPITRANLQDGDRIRIGATILHFGAQIETSQRPGPKPPVPETGLFQAVSIFESDELIGQSTAFVHAIELATRVAGVDSTVLIIGEDGTGKETFARVIHRNSQRRQGPFVSVHCGSIDPQVLPGELFGIEAGAADMPGRFELANGGTLFLDEIDKLPAAVQPQVLRAIESGEVIRIGARSGRPVDVRVVGASDGSIQDKVVAGEYREDLYFKLNTLEIPLPSLREREEDVTTLAQHFVRELGRSMGKSAEDFDSEAHGLLLRYGWPGNVRELRNVVERAMILCDGKLIAAAHLPQEISGDALVRTDVDVLDSLQDVETRHIRRVLETCDGNKKKAARILGIDRSTLYARLKEMGLHEPKSD